MVDSQEATWQHVRVIVNTWLLPSQSVAVAPFIINYSGILFREYPGPWQCMLKQDNGQYACVAERKVCWFFFSFFFASGCFLGLLLAMDA